MRYQPAELEIGNRAVGYFRFGLGTAFPEYLSRSVPFDPVPARVKLVIESLSAADGVVPEVIKGLFHIAPLVITQNPAYPLNGGPVTLEKRPARSVAASVVGQDVPMMQGAIAINEYLFRHPSVRVVLAIDDIPRATVFVAMSLAHIITVLIIEISSNVIDRTVRIDLRCLSPSAFVVVDGDTGIGQHALLVIVVRFDFSTLSVIGVAPIPCPFQ